MVHGKNTLTIFRCNRHDDLTTYRVSTVWDFWGGAMCGDLLAFKAAFSLVLKRSVVDCGVLVPLCLFSRLEAAGSTLMFVPDGRFQP
eukprot:4467774-Amphidinium_carterae.1